VSSVARRNAPYLNNEGSPCLAVRLGLTAKTVAMVCGFPAEARRPPQAPRLGGVGRVGGVSLLLAPPALPLLVTPLFYSRQRDKEALPSSSGKETALGRT